MKGEEVRCERYGGKSKVRWEKIGEVDITENLPSQD